MNPLTRRQQDVLNFIRERHEGGMSAPSVRDIAAEFGFASPSTAQLHLDALKKKGYLTGEDRAARSLRLAREDGKRVSGVPLLGSIPAGHGDLRDQEADGMVYVDLESLRLPAGARTFALKVTGDSMVGKHIQDGDMVILEETTEPFHGEVVAALIDGQSTLKTFVREKGRAWLRAENPRYPDLIPAGELVIQGVMRMVVRQTRARAR